MINNNFEEVFDLEKERVRAEIDKRKLNRYITNKLQIKGHDSRGNRFIITKDPNNYVYKGGWNEGKMEGYGKIKYKTGLTYEGYWKNSQRNGYGKYSLPNGIVFEGNFVDGYLDRHAKVHIDDKELDILFDKGNAVNPKNIDTNEKKILYYSLDFLNQLHIKKPPYNVISVLTNGDLITAFNDNQPIDYSRQTKNTIRINSHGDTNTIITQDGKAAKKSTMVIDDLNIRNTEDVLDYILKPIIQQNIQLPGKLDIKIDACLQYELSTPAFREKITKMLNNNSKIFGNNVSIYFVKELSATYFKVKDMGLPFYGDHSYRLDFIKQKYGTFESSIRRDYTAEVLEKVAIRSTDSDMIRTRF